jgi:tetratricopeptide (TPR) repeat protein
VVALQQPKHLLWPPGQETPWDAADRNEPVAIGKDWWLNVEPLRSLERKPLERSHHLEQIAREADRHTRHGFELAGRKAYFSARSEFIKALRLIAQGLDAEHRTHVHSRALSRALTALEEAGQFVPRGSCLEGDLDLSDIVGGHRTDVLSEAAVGRITALEALQRYLTHAQEQLRIAAGGEVAGSMALHALGKLHAVLARQRTVDVRVAEPKAVAFYQAALLVRPENYMAANDLGVLLARSGRHEDARTMLEHSLSVHSHASTRRNLATVYAKLGRGELVRQDADRTRVADKAAPAKTPGGSIRWVDPGTFARLFARSPTVRPPAAVRHAPAPVETTAPKATPKPRVARGWPWNLLEEKRK